MNKTEIIHLRLDSDILELIRANAIKNYRTIAKEINYTLRELHASKEGQ